MSEDSQPTAIVNLGTEKVNIVNYFKSFFRFRLLRNYIANKMSGFFMDFL